MFDPYSIREDFPILRRTVNGHPIIYFDNAATSQKPRSVIDAMKKFYEENNANIHRAVHTLSQEATELYEEAHKEVASFINAESYEEVVFVKNTTEAINLVAYSWGSRLNPDDEVSVTLMEHHSNIVPWWTLSKFRNFKLKYVDVKGDGTLNYEDLEQQITEKTRFVCVTHVSNVTGVINDIKRISKLAHENDALLLVDGAQSAPHMPVDVKKLGVDFLAFSSHKMLGPTGIGVLYARRELLEEGEPFLFGGGMIKDVCYVQNKGDLDVSWNELPWKFEAGTPNVCGAVGLMEAVRYLRRLGMENVYIHERNLALYALERIEEVGGIRVYGPGKETERCGIIPFNMTGIDSHDLALLLDQFGIMVRSGLHCAQPLHQRLGLKSSVRASFYIYNTREEVDRMVDILNNLSEGLKRH
ncbi:MAG: cysteine desulfurase [Candidatus Freyarchaeota archaeon]|nr:cysteine desulfurase [Candidatus Jordarchaeia archaeon]